MRTNQYLAHIGSVAAPLGAILFFVSGLLHPSDSDPNVPVAAFAEYVSSSHWVGIHLAQFAGLASMALALLALGATFEPGPAAAWGRIGVAGALVSLAIYAANQGVDGIANRVAELRWASASGQNQALAFEAAFAVRQIEVALTSLFSLLLGSTLGIFGLAMLYSQRYPGWLGAVGILGGLATLAIGLEQASNGFSDLALTGFMVVGPVALIWVVVSGILMRRLVPRLVEGSKTA